MSTLLRQVVPYRKTFAHFSPKNISGVVPISKKTALQIAGLAGAATFCCCRRPGSNLAVRCASCQVLGPVLGLVEHLCLPVELRRPTRPPRFLQVPFFYLLWPRLSPLARPPAVAQLVITRSPSATTAAAGGDDSAHFEAELPLSGSGQLPVAGALFLRLPHVQTGRLARPTAPARRSFIPGTSEPSPPRANGTMVVGALGPY